MSIKPQLDLNIKQCVFFIACKLEGNWKHNSCNDEYTAVENGSSIVLSLTPSLTKTLYFKKGSIILIKNNHISYYDHDLS